MRFVFLFAVLSLGSAMALAADDVSATSSERRDDQDIRFRCNFRSLEKKGIRCEARGEVCVEGDRGKQPGVTEEHHRCDKDRDDNRLEIRCSNGFEDRDRATAFVRRDREERRGEDLIISSRERRDDRETITIEEFDRFDRDHHDLSDDRDRDDIFRSTLRIDQQGRFHGECRLEKERDRRDLERPLPELM